MAMSITFNVFGGTATSDAASPMAAGASVELAQAEGPGAPHAHAATDAGPPMATLVQEVEAALLMARAAAPDAMTLPSGIDAGAAPM